MKKILSFFVAGALALGLIGCSGDLHDVDNSPFSETQTVFLIGGIADSTADSSQYVSRVDSPAKGYEIELTDGKFSFEFTYTGNDSWSAGAGNHAMTIMSNVDGGWDGAIARWGNANVSVGGSGSISLSGSNLVLTGLEAGTKYTLTGSLTAAGGTVGLAKGLSGVSMDIINIKDNVMSDAFSATAAESGDTYKFTYMVDAATAGEMSFVIRVGMDVWIPDGAATLAEGKNVVISSSTRFDKIDSVEYPITFRYDKWSFGYEMTFELDTQKDELTVSVVQLSGMYIASNIKAGWAAMTPEDDDGKVWSITGTGASLSPGWGPIYGINTERAYNDSTFRAMGDGTSSIKELGKSYPMAIPAKGGDRNKNVEVPLSLNPEAYYKVTFTVTGDGTGTVSITEN